MAEFNDSEEKKFFCLNCGEGFSRRYRLALHLQLIHDDELNARYHRSLDSEYQQDDTEPQESNDTEEQKDDTESEGINDTEEKEDDTDVAESGDIETKKYFCLNCGEGFSRRYRLALHLQLRGRGPHRSLDPGTP